MIGTFRVTVDTDPAWITGTVVTAYWTYYSMNTRFLTCMSKPMRSTPLIRHQQMLWMFISVVNHYYMKEFSLRHLLFL